MPKYNIKYKNPYSKVKNMVLNIILWKSGFYGFFKKRKKLSKKVLKRSLKTSQNFSFKKEEPSIVWINHSTFLINAYNLSILTDPVWSEKCSPFSLFGPKRHHLPAFPIEELKKVDFVLISHNHYDHLDNKTILKLHKKFKDITWIVPKGVKKWFLKRKIFNVFEFGWWEKFKFLENISITAVPSQHFSCRNFLFDYNKSFWAGYVVDFLNKKKKFYFAGDTGYNDKDFKKIGEKFENIDLSLIPIGCYLPRNILKKVHISPFEAIKIHKDVKSSFSIGMHWKTFSLSDEPESLPPHDLFLAKKEKNIKNSKFIVIEPGKYVNW